MSSRQRSLNKVKETLVKLKESVDEAEERVIEANQQKQEADTRLEEAEEEIEYYRRRIKLIQADLVKTKKTLGEKQETLAHVERRSLDDDEKRREYEGIEVEKDDQLIAAEEALTARQEAAESTHVLMKIQRKLQVVQVDLERVYQRLVNAGNKEKSYLETIEWNGEELRNLEDRDVVAKVREMEAEEKLRFLGEQLKKEVVRAENAERDVVRNENIVAIIRNDLDNMQKKHDEIGKEIDRIDDLVDAINSGDVWTSESELEPEQEPEDE